MSYQLFVNLLSEQNVLSEYTLITNHVLSGFFITKIFHPNVAKNGEICVNTLKKDWKPDLGIKHILLVSEL